MKWNKNAFIYESGLNDNSITFKELEKRIYKYACVECNNLKKLKNLLDEYLGMDII